MPTIRDTLPDWLPVECVKCKRRSSVPITKLTPDFHKALERMRCKRCGWRGRPRTFGWVPPRAENR